VSVAEFWSYLCVFLALVGAGMGLPIPEEVPVVTGGALCGQVEEPEPRPTDVAGLLALTPGQNLPGGLFWAAAYRCAYPEPKPDALRLRWWIMLPVCILGVVFSDGLLYGIGRFFGRRILEFRWMARLVPHEKVKRIEQNFHKYGIKILLFARFLPGIRAPIFVTAGIMRLPLNKFLLADGLYAIPGVSLLFTLAFWFTNSFKELIENTVVRAEAHLQPIIILVVIVGVCIYLVLHFLRKPVSEGAPEEFPIIGPQVAAHLRTEGDACPQAAPVNGEAAAEAARQAEARPETQSDAPRP
jgi:membrane protein DedA with SNARE-associated domain